MATSAGSGKSEQASHEAGGLAAALMPLDAVQASTKGRAGKRVHGESCRGRARGTVLNGPGFT